MSSIVNKIKDAVHPHQPGSEPTGTHGPHSSRAANAADPRVDSDRDHRAAPGTMGSSTDYTSSNNYTYTPATGTTTSTNAGPHQSNLANKMDPRVDSDRDHRGAPGHTGMTGTTHGTSTNAGPHQSNLANKLDPRVDSDRDHRGAPGHTGMTGATGTTGTTYSSGLTGSNTRTTAGPHQSDMMNKLDPRVDSDRDHRGAPGHSGRTGATGTTYGTSARTTGYDDPEGTHGPHSSRVANTVDPRVDSDRDHRGAPNSYSAGTTGGSTMGTTGTTGRTTGMTGTSGPGPAANTAGPHKSDMMNKVDPRVDSDLNGSTTIGGNKTYHS